MGIDGIGKGRGVPPTGVPDASPNEVAGKAPFRVERGTSDASSSVTGSTSVGSAGEVSPALAKLRAGEVDVNGYMDLRVDEATRGLEGLPPAELAEIKRVLRDQMATDPGLAELVTRATGEAPTPPEE